MQLSYASHSPDIPLSAASPSLRLESHAATLPYVPPHPQRGTPYHRYTLLLLEQQQASDDDAAVSREARQQEARAPFDVRRFVESNRLVPRGVSMFRQVWDATVSDIYAVELNRT